MLPQEVVDLRVPLLAKLLNDCDLLIGEHRALADLGLGNRGEADLDPEETVRVTRRQWQLRCRRRGSWGQGAVWSVRGVESAVGRVGALACWEHYNPLARYALMADHEEIHA